jgi:short subunit fatty acids transporter
MLLILLVLILALLPLMLTTALPQLMIVSIYAGLAHLLALAWAMMIVAIVVRRHRIAEWRTARKLRKIGTKRPRVARATN